MTFPIDNEKITLFVKDVIKTHLLPNARYAGASAAGTLVDGKIRHAYLKLLRTYGSFYQSKYYYEGESQFIHYTTVKNLINILRDKKLRLYDLRGVDDKDEFHYASKLIGGSRRDKAIEDVKSKVFCFSMCKYEIEATRRSLNLWRNYGDDGRGMAFVFTFQEESKDSWFNYMLSEMHYGDNQLNELLKTCDTYSSWKKENDFQVLNFHELLYTLCCFHKQEIYSDEKEVRMLYANDFDSNVKTSNKPDLNRKNQITSYKELDIEHIQKTHPYIKIEKIIFGYRLSDFEKTNIRELLESLLENYTNNPLIEESLLRDYFK